MDIQQLLFAATQAVQAAAETAKEISNASEDPGLLGTLGIDWRLFLAQLVNFSIVLFLFWRWIVKPLGSTLTLRQERIEQGLKNATYMEEEKAKFDLWKDEELRRVRSEADGILKSANEVAGQARQEMLKEAQTQAEKMLKQAEAAIESEKAQMFREIREEAATLVTMATEKILKQKLDPKKDSELVSKSLEK